MKEFVISWFSAHSGELCMDRILAKDYVHALQFAMAAVGGCEVDEYDGLSEDDLLHIADTCDAWIEALEL